MRATGQRRKRILTNYRCTSVRHKSLFGAVVLGSLLLLSAGCAGRHSARATAIASKGIAPDDVALRPNPNAPYIMPGTTPRLIPRATAQDAANAGPCDPEVLSVEEIAGDTNGIYRSVKLAFMNRGAVPCRLGGYPGISLLDSAGQTIGSITTQKVTNAEVLAELSKPGTAAATSPAPNVTLMPHAVAAFQVVWSTGAGCSSVAEIQVTAPGTQRIFPITRPMKICAGRIQVTELRLDEGDV